MRTRVRAALCLVALSAVGCQRMQYDVSGSMFAPPRDNVVAGLAGSSTRTANASGWSHYLLFGLIPVHRVDLADALKPMLKPGETITDVKIEEVNSAMCEIAAVLTLGIYRPRSIEITAAIQGGAT